MATRQLLGGVEFTHEWYQSLLGHLLDDGYTFRTFTRQPQEGDLLLRHDVDLSLDDALTMAGIEAELGVKSTYCILLSSPLYNPFDPEQAAKIREIDALGHDIGLHFSTHGRWEDGEPSPTAVEKEVRHGQATLDGIVPDVSSAVSFHRPPSWVLGQRFTGFRNTYSPTYFTDIAYLADSNQRWREEPPELDELPETLQILTHPGLWGERDEQFEDRIQGGVIDSCRFTNRRAREEFIDPNR